MSYQNKHRLFVEQQIAKFAINSLLEAGFTLSVNDGEDTVLHRSADAPSVFSAMFSTDEDYLIAHVPTWNTSDDSDRCGWIRFIYGNDGPDVINDHTVETYPVFDVVMAKVSKWVDCWEELGNFPSVPLRVGTFENIGSL